MPYLFGLLVIANALLFAFFVFVHEPKTDDSVATMQASLTQPISFENTSEHTPPLIGTKK